MRLARFATSALAATWLTVFAHGALAGACQLQVIGELPVTMQGNTPLVDVTLNDHPVRFILDTGAATTELTKPGAESLGLHLIQLSGVTVYGAGGSTGANRARVRELKLGGTVVHDFDMLVAGKVGADGYVGLLGRDVLLARNDLELDLAHHVVRLIKPKDCQGDQVVYWSQSYSLASVAFDRWNTINVNASLNGRPVSAELDSGAYYSIVTLEAARAAGVTPESRGVVAAGGTSGMGGVVQTWGGTFQTLGVGSETVKNAQLQLGDLFSKNKEVALGSIIPTNVVDLPGMLLGADFVKAHRIYIAVSQGKLYFTYNGGQIFELPAAKAADDARAAIDDHPSTAQGHLDRGSALMGAARYAEALAEFDAAIAADAKSQRAWDLRAFAHAWLADPAAATDADRADVLGSPDAIAARARALFAANTGDLAGARAAFRRVLTLSPDDAFALRHLFALDLQAGDAEAAAQDLERLKQTEPGFASRDYHLWKAELEQAAGRRDAAEREAAQGAADTADALNERARTYLKLGDVERGRTDVDAAIRSKPSVQAWLLRASLDGGYGSPDADADIAAAGKLAPDDARVIRWKLNAAITRRDFAGALPLMETLIAAHKGGSGDLWVGRGEIEARLDRRAEADADFTRARAATGAETPGVDVLCHAEASVRWTPETALSDCERDLQRAPMSVRLQVDHIVLLHRLARDPEAVRALDALEAQPRTAAELNSICYDLAVEGIDLERALADCDASLKSRPGDAATLDSRGFVLMRLGRDAAALEAYNAALAVEPNEYNSLYGRGLVEARMGRTDDSARDIHAALAARPYLRRDFEEMGIK